MTSANLMRLGGLAAVMATAFLLVLDIADYAQGDDPFRVATGAPHAFESTLRMIAFEVLPLGLVGLYICVGPQSSHPANGRSWLLPHSP